MCDNTLQLTKCTYQALAISDFFFCLLMCWYMITIAMMRNPTLVSRKTRTRWTKWWRNNYSELTIMMITTGVMKAQMKYVSYRNQHLMIVRYHSTYIATCSYYVSHTQAVLHLPYCRLHSDYRYHQCWLGNQWVPPQPCRQEEDLRREEVETHTQSSCCHH